MSTAIMARTEKYFWYDFLAAGAKKHVLTLIVANNWNRNFL